MKKYIYILLTVFVTAALFSCEEDINPIPPTFKGFIVSPKPAMPGDTVKVKLYFADKGKHIYLPQPQNSYWTLTLDTLATDGTVNNVTLSSYERGSIGNDFLSKEFILPKTTLPSTKTCHVMVKFSCSADCKQTVIRKNTLMPGYEGDLGNSEITGLLYGEFNGSVKIQIVEPQ